MGRLSNFVTGSQPHKDIQDYLGPAKASEEPEDDFSLPPEKEAYYKGAREGAEHREKLASLKGQAAKNEYIRGIREGLKQDDRPKRGDLDNPLRKDMPKQPAAPRQRVQRAPDPMANVRKMRSLARKASGKRR